MNQPDFASTFFVLDFDRCIGDTDKLHEILWSVIENETGILASALRAAKKETEADGATFYTMEYVHDELGRRGSIKNWQDVRQAYVAAAKQQDILEPGAQRLLDMLDQRGIPYGILTFGNELWQLTKLEAAGLIDRGVSFEITQIEHKGKVLSGWRRDSEFILPPALARDDFRVLRIVFLDDKPRSFIGLPEGVRGICVRPLDDTLHPSQQGPLPVGVDEVRGISGAIALIFD